MSILQRYLLVRKTSLNEYNNKVVKTAPGKQLGNKHT